MTREEAIRVLRNIAFQFGSVMRADSITAVDMAIEALSADATVAKIQIDDIDKAKTSSRLLDDLAVDMVKAMDKRIVEVVRCKDCKWQKFIDWGMGDCLHPKGSKHIAYDNHYCSYGERKEP